MRRVGATMAVLALLAGAAHADDALMTRKLRFAERGPDLVVTGSFSDVFDEEMREQLQSGFVTTVFLRVYLFRAGQDIPIFFAAATYRVSYDVWDKVFDVRIRDPMGERNYREPTRQEALTDVTTMNQFPVAPLKEIKIGPSYFIGVVVEVNPVSPELLAEVRRWVARPQGGSDQAQAGSSFFGSFVSIFINPKIEEADRTLRFRSQTVYRQEPPKEKEPPPKENK
jgi:hypothetical protein